MKFNKIFFVTSLVLCFSLGYGQTYLKSDRNDATTEILSKILKEIEGLKKGQEKLANDLKALKVKAPAAPKKSAGTPAQTAIVKNVPIGNSMVLGNPDAPITIVKWTDFQWPYCAKSVGLMDDILKLHPNDVKVVVKNFPLSFHKQARLAAKYALAASRQGKYKEMYHMIMENFRKLKTNPDLPLEYAQELGLNMVQFKADAKDPVWEELIKKESKELQDNFERKSVPKFLVAGKEPKGRDLKTFSDMIKAELAKTK